MHPDVIFAVLYKKNYFKTGFFAISESNSPNVTGLILLSLMKFWSSVNSVKILNDQEREKVGKKSNFMVAKLHFVGGKSCVLK